MTFKKILLMVVGISIIVGTYYDGNTGEKTERWILYGKTELGDHYYDKNSITNVSSNILKVWFKRKYSKVGKEKLIQLIKDNNMSIRGWEKLDYEIGLVELDCLNNTDKLIKNIQYNDKGKILKEHVMENPQIHQTIPGSLGEELLRKVCK